MFTVLSSWQSHWLPVKQRVEYKLCMMIHRGPGGPDHAVGRCNCQTWSQICRIQFGCSATNYDQLYSPKGRHNNKIKKNRKYIK